MNPAGVSQHQTLCVADETQNKLYELSRHHLVLNLPWCCFYPWMGQVKLSLSIPALKDGLNAKPSLLQFLEIMMRRRSSLEDEFIFLPSKGASCQNIFVNLFSSGSLSNLCCRRCDEFWSEHFAFFVSVRPRCVKALNVLLWCCSLRIRGHGDIYFFSSSKSNTLPFPLILTQGNDYAWHASSKGVVMIQYVTAAHLAAVGPPKDCMTTGRKARRADLKWFTGCNCHLPDKRLLVFTPP